MHSYKYFILTIALLLAALGATAAYFLYEINHIHKDTTGQVTRGKIQSAYQQVNLGLSYEEDAATLQNVLATFRDIAADESKSNDERSQALNGIYAAYTDSNSNAQAIADVVFSHPFFARYYTPATSTSADPVRPASGNNVEAVEKGLEKLLELSNALSPNHYAIVRLATAQMFAFDRAASKNPDERQALKQSYGRKVQDYLDAYAALPPLASMKNYALTRRMQIQYLHAGALEFAGSALGNSASLQESEEEYLDVIYAGDAYGDDKIDSQRVLNQVLFARIFYVTHFWYHYKLSDPKRMQDIIRPLTTVDPSGLTVIEKYLPSRMSASGGPSRALRDMSAQMPELKSFLQGLGWEF